MPESLLKQQRTSPRDLFPRPDNNAIVETNPPVFSWLPVEGASRYHVIVRDSDGSEVFDGETTRNVLIPRLTFPAGDYQWDVRSGGQRRGWWMFRVDENARDQVAPTAEQTLEAVPGRRPRHLFYEEDIQAILSARPIEVGILRRNIELARDEGLPSLPMFHLTDDPRRSACEYRAAFARHRQFVDRNLVACALGHVLLGDRRAGAHARAIMLNVCAWNPDGPCAIDSPWGDEIGLSHLRCLPAVFDWTYDLYSAYERRFIADTIASYARQARRRLDQLDFFSQPGHPLCGRLPAYLGEAALVLKGHVDIEEAGDWLQCAMDVYSSVFPHYGGRDGGWAEGAFHGGSATRWYLPFFLALERHTGFNYLDGPFYRRLTQFFTHFAPPGWEVHPFGDGYWRQAEDKQWPGSFAQDPFRVYAERFGPKVARRFSEMLLKVEHFDLHLLDVFTRPPRVEQDDIAGVIRRSRVFPDTGLVSLHSDSRAPAEDNAVLARASRFGTGGAQHADQGSFAIISKGRGLITPSGYLSAGSNANHHRLWTRQTRAHNCLLVNGAGQHVDSHEATGSVETLIDEGSHALTWLDVTDAYGALGVTRCHRALLLIRPDIVIVYDDTEAEKPVSVSWLAHSLSKPKIKGDHVTINRRPARLDLRLFSDANEPLKYTMTDRFDPPVNDGVPDGFHVKHDNQFHMRWDAPLSRRRRFVAVMSLNGGVVETEHCGEELVARVGGKEFSFSFRRARPAEVKLGGVMIPR